MRHRFAPIIVRWCRIGIVIVALSSAGCAHVNWRGDGFSDSLAEIGRQLRPMTDNGDQFGVSTKAREIERDLGYK